jgi:hypothetical protein
MLLTEARISGFRSFRRAVDIFFSARTTILIGPNDHGKTNVLLAVDKLSPDKEFAPSDVNDRAGVEAASITFRLSVSDAEIGSVEIGISPLLEQEAAKQSEAFTLAANAGDGAPSVESPTSMLKLLGGGSPVKQWWNHTRKSRIVEFVRDVGKPLGLKADALEGATRDALLKVLLPLMPKIFLFTDTALRQLPDTVNLSTLENNEVMQGVFRLAGIWEDRKSLLSGNTRQNQDRLREASSLLTSQVRKNWTQGKDLEFFLEYVGNDIRLTVKDTAKTVTAIGDRSQGFTAYFAMRMLLVARTDQATPNGYVFMFDEPGLNLHPKGQVDLQNVFEDIARTNQIIYSTHSVFLINKNDPKRNHLIYKNEQGSNVDNKPFVGGWARVKEHLGLYLTANFLFADKVLLAEGATDEIYLPLILQGLIERGLFEGDLNSFAIRSSLNSKEMLAVAATYLQEQRSVTVLIDGDVEGGKRKSKIEAWAGRAKVECPAVILSEFRDPPCSIEDFLEPSTFENAVIAACKQLVDGGHVQPKEKGDWPADLKRLLKTADGRGGAERRSLGKRVEVATAEVFGESISDNAIAIQYGELIRREPVDAERLAQYWQTESLQRLASAIWASLKLPTRGDVSRIPFAG